MGKFRSGTRAQFASSTKSNRSTRNGARNGKKKHLKKFTWAYVIIVSFFVATWILWSVTIAHCSLIESHGKGFGLFIAEGDNNNNLCRMYTSMERDIFFDTPSQLIGQLFGVLGFACHSIAFSLFIVCNVKSKKGKYILKFLHDPKNKNFGGVDNDDSSSEISVGTSDGGQSEAPVLSKNHKRRSKVQKLWKVKQLFLLLSLLFLFSTFIFSAGICAKMDNAVNNDNNTDGENALDGGAFTVSPEDVERGFFYFDCKPGIAGICAILNAILIVDLLLISKYSNPIRVMNDIRVIKDAQWNAASESHTPSRALDIELGIVEQKPKKKRRSSIINILRGGRGNRNLNALDLDGDSDVELESHKRGGKRGSENRSTADSDSLPSIKSVYESDDDTVDPNDTSGKFDSTGSPEDIKISSVRVDRNGSKRSERKKKKKMKRSSSMQSDDDDFSMESVYDDDDSDEFDEEYNDDKFNNSAVSFNDSWANGNSESSSRGGSARKSRVGALKNMFFRNSKRNLKSASPDRDNMSEKVNIDDGDIKMRTSKDNEKGDKINNILDRLNKATAAVNELEGMVGDEKNSVDELNISSSSDYDRNKLFWAKPQKKVHAENYNSDTDDDDDDLIKVKVSEEVASRIDQWLGGQPLVSSSTSTTATKQVAKNSQLNGIEEESIPEQPSSATNGKRRAKPRKFGVLEDEAIPPPTTTTGRRAKPRKFGAAEDEPMSLEQVPPTSTPPSGKRRAKPRKFGQEVESPIAQSEQEPQLQPPTTTTKRRAKPRKFSIDNNDSDPNDLRKPIVDFNKNGSDGSGRMGDDSDIPSVDGVE